MVPHDLGGEGASIADVADVCYQLGQSCSSTGMIYAMHQIKIAVHRAAHGRQRLVATAAAPPVRRAVAARLLDHRGSGRRKRALERGADRAAEGNRIALERKATVISYGAYADGVVTRRAARRTRPSSDQVLVALLKSDYTLTQAAGLERARHARYLQRRLHAEGELGRPTRCCRRPTRRSTRAPWCPPRTCLWGSVWTGIAASATSARTGLHQTTRCATATASCHPARRSSRKADVHPAHAARHADHVAAHVRAGA